MERTEVSSCGLGRRPESKTNISQDHHSRLPYLNMLVARLEMFYQTKEDFLEEEPKQLPHHDSGRDSKGGKLPHTR